MGRGAGRGARSWRRPTTTSRCTGSRTPTGCCPSATTARPTRPSRCGGSRPGSTTSSSPTGSSAGPTGWATPARGCDPGSTSCAARALSAPRSSATCPHKVFTSPRRVVFREMEYAVPREAGLEALREVRALIERSDWLISFPVEVRFVPARRRPALDRPRARLGLPRLPHQPADRPHRRTSRGSRRCCEAHDGRPHWGKLHTRTAADLAPSYPRWEDFLAMRDRLDPDRLFANPYLERVLGP